MRCDFSLGTCRDRVTAKGKGLRESRRAHAQPLAAVAGKRRFACSDVWLSQWGAEGLRFLLRLYPYVRSLHPFNRPLLSTTHCTFFSPPGCSGFYTLAKRIFPQIPNPKSPNASRLIQPGRVTFQRYTGKQRMISGRCNNVSLHKLIAERLVCAILMSMSMSNLSWTGSNSLRPITPRLPIETTISNHLYRLTVTL